MQHLTNGKVFFIKRLRVKNTKHILVGGGTGKGGIKGIRNRCNKPGGGTGRGGICESLISVGSKKIVATLMTDVPEVGGREFRGEGRE